jgi:anti-sigma regulatory factor (Ser/Thr protein kinase)
MTRTAAGARGFRHELFLHRSTDDLLTFVVPFARDAVAAREPTLLLLGPDTAGAVADELPPSPYLAIQPALVEPGRPAQHVAAAGPLLSTYARVVHQEPVIPPGQWPEWRCLEAALNLVMRHYDTWAVCAYDERNLTPSMVEDLHATHPLVRRDGCHRPNDRYRHPADLLGGRGDASLDRVEQTPPAVEIVDPSPATARAAVNWFTHQRLPSSEIDELVFATNEAVTNALDHGQPPTVLRLWTEPDRIVVTVADAGPGPDDRSTPPGLEARSGPALGLWLIHQLVDASHRRRPDGYTVRLVKCRTHAGID